MLSNRLDSSGKAAITLPGRDSASSMIKARNISTVSMFAVNEASDPMNSVTSLLISSMEIMVWSPSRSML